MTKAFAFRPALLRAKVEWRLDGDHLHGPDGALDFRKVTAARLVETTIRDSRMRRLDLAQKDHLTRIAINIGKGAGRDDPDLAAHRTLCQAVAEQLATTQPDLLVTIGETRAARKAMFAVGLLALLIGLGIGVAALATGVSSDRLAGIAFPLLLMVVFGVVVANTHAPWRPLPHVPVAALPGLLDTLDQREG